VWCSCIQFLMAFIDASRSIALAVTENSESSL
jgi:hypothetical protein